MKQPLLLPFLFLFTVACGDAPDPTGTPTPTMVAETPTPTATISSQKSEHCGEITTDEIWTEAANPHTLTCSVEIVGGSVTLEAGVVVTVDPGGLSLSVISGGLNLAGNTADPITLKPVAGDSWYGVLIQEGAGDVILTHSKLMGAIQYPGTIDLNTGPLIIRGAEVHIDSVEIEGPTECALVIKDGGRLSDESHGLTVHSSEGWPVCASPLGAGSLPGIEKASNYTGSLTDAVLVTLDYRELASSSSWEDLGIPYLINGPMTVQTDTLDPAILTLEPGVELRFVEEGYLSIGKYTHPGTAGLIVAGTEDKPVLFSGYEGTNPGAWGGVFAYGATDYSLAHLTLENGGFESDGALISMKQAL